MEIICTTSTWRNNTSRVCGGGIFCDGTSPLNRHFFLLPPPACFGIHTTFFFFFFFSAAALKSHWSTHGLGASARSVKFRTLPSYLHVLLGEGFRTLIHLVKYLSKDLGGCLGLRLRAGAAKPLERVRGFLA